MFAIFYVQRVVDVVFGVVGLLLCSLVIALSFRLKQMRTVRQYRLMIVGNAAVDWLYSVTTAATMSSAVMCDNLVFVIFNNPLIPSTYLAVELCICIHLFIMFFSVTMLPIQFIFRYGILRNKPYSNLQMCGWVFLFGMIAAIHGLISPLTFNTPGRAFDIAIVESMGIEHPERPPAYVSTLNLMTLHFANIFVTAFITIVAIIVAVCMSSQTITLDDSRISNAKTRMVQRQVTRVLYLQSIYPLFVVVIPCTLFAYFSVRGHKVNYVPEVCMMLIHSTPIINQASVMLCMPCYRSVITKRLFSKVHTTEIYSTQRESENVLKVSV